MEAQVCRYCGSRDVVLDPERGYYVCRSCGTIQDYAYYDYASPTQSREGAESKVSRVSVISNPRLRALMRLNQYVTRDNRDSERGQRLDAVRQYLARILPMLGLGGEDFSDALWLAREMIKEREDPVNIAVAIALMLAVKKGVAYAKALKALGNADVRFSKDAAITLSRKYGGLSMEAGNVVGMAMKSVERGLSKLGINDTEVRARIMGLVRARWWGSRSLSPRTIAAVTIYYVLAEELRRVDITQKVVAKAVGISEPTIRDYLPLLKVWVKRQGRESRESKAKPAPMQASVSHHGEEFIIRSPNNPSEVILQVWR